MLCKSISFIIEFTYYNLQGKLCNFQVSVFLDSLKSVLSPFLQKLTKLCNSFSFINECTDCDFFTKQGTLCKFRDSLFLDSFMNECYLTSFTKTNKVKLCM